MEGGAQKNREERLQRDQFLVGKDLWLSTKSSGTWTDGVTDKWYPSGTDTEDFTSSFGLLICFHILLREICETKMCPRRQSEILSRKTVTKYYRLDDLKKV